MSNQVNDLLKVIQRILEIELDDGIVWEKPFGEALNHPEMNEPGARIMCHFLLGRMRGQIQIDLALGDVVKPVYFVLPRLDYNGIPLVNGDFSVLTYPPESIFAEKLHIILSKRENNSRMKDYYDLLKLSQSSMKKLKLKNSIEATFKNREMKVADSIFFEEEALNMIQAKWASFLAKEKLNDAPNKISDVIETINNILKTIF
jgi:hypothetical protein